MMNVTKLLIIALFTVFTISNCAPYVALAETAPPNPTDQVSPYELSPDPTLKDVLVLTKGIEVVPAWVESIGQCISTLGGEWNNQAAQGAAATLVKSGALHILFWDRAYGSWGQKAQYVGKSEDWDFAAARSRLWILAKIIDKAIPAEYNLTVEWWDEHSTFRLYFYPWPYNDLSELSENLKRLQTVKLKN